jgi:hypothetical protein
MAVAAYRAQNRGSDHSAPIVVEVLRALIDLMDALRLVLRVSRSTAQEAGVEGPGSDVPVPGPLVPGQADPPALRISSGTAVAVRRSGFPRALRRAKQAGALRPGDAIRLESAERVVITYVSGGFAPTDRYIEWRGPPLSNWANVPGDVHVLLA